MSTPLKRPVGVLVVVLVLGVLAALELAGAGLFGIAGMAYHGIAARPGVPPPPVPSSMLMKGMFAGLVVFCMMLGGWTAATLVGLLGLRRWSRYSVLVLGGLLAFFSVLSIFGLVVTAAAGMRQPAGVPPHTMQAVLLFMALVYAALAGVGVWWLVYFNLQSVRAAFRQDPQGSLAAPSDVIAPPFSHAGAHPAQPPLLIVVLGCLFLVAALVSLVVACLPLPMFLFGAILGGSAEHLAYAVLVVLNGAIGVGLLRLDNKARLATYALLVLGSLNLLLLTLPRYQASLLAYNAQMVRSMGLPPQPPGLNPMLRPGFFAISALPGIVIYLLIFWVLHRHRGLFLRESDADKASRTQ